MKTLKLLPLCYLVILAACGELTDCPDRIEHQSRSVLSPQGAISRIEEFAHNNGIYTKSSDFSSIIAFGEKDLDFPVTKGQNEYPEIPDTLLYFINFEKEGYSIISADARDDYPIYAFTESGIMSTEHLVNIFQILNDKEGDKTLVDDDFPTLIVMSSIINSYRKTENGINSTDEDDTDDTDPDNPIPWDDGPYKGGGNSLKRISPIVKTKWTQSISPFNDLTPNKYPAGCVCIAVAQIVVANKYSGTMTFNNVLCEWDKLESVFRYDYPFYMVSSDANNQVANFILELGKGSYCDISYAKEGSSASATDAKRAFKKIGYSNVHRFWNPLKLTSDNKWRVYRMLEKGYPVYMEGGCWKGKTGHAWVVDGFLPEANTSKVSDGYFHINWGHRGMDDGYFKVGCFDQEKRTYKEGEIDKFSSLSGEKHHYDFDYTIIEYSIPK